MEDRPGAFIKDLDALKEKHRVDLYFTPSRGFIVQCRSGDEDGSVRIVTREQFASEVERMMEVLALENVRVSLICTQRRFVVRIWDGNTGLSAGCDGRSLESALHGAMERYQTGAGHHDPQLKLEVCPRCGFLKN